VSSARQHNVTIMSDHDEEEDEMRCEKRNAALRCRDSGCSQTRTRAVGSLMSFGSVRFGSTRDTARHRVTATSHTRRIIAVYQQRQHTYERGNTTPHDTRLTQTRRRTTRDTRRSGQHTYSKHNQTTRRSPRNYHIIDN